MARPVEVDRTLVHDSPVISVWSYPQVGIIHHQMHGHCFGEVLRAALFAGTRAMKKSQATAWLSDDRVNSALAPADEEWSTNQWFPETKAAGWKLWALVKPESAIGALQMNRYVKIYGDLGIEARFFMEPEPGFEWLCERLAAA
jgi:hypothetical protein